MNYVSSYKDLEVYKVSRTLSAEVFRFSREFPKEEKYSLTDQVRRSSRSVGAQIAEAWGKRRYVYHFISKLSDADSEQLETQHWLEVASECQYLSENDKFMALNHCESIGRMLQSMMDKSSLFCKPK